jgi:glyoxylase-like metal-dependent hydrolase (beta-lactamase superfamily II)
MTGPRTPPPVDIPPSQHTVEVCIIDTTSYMSGFPASTFVEPDVPGFDFMNVKSYSYIIKHKSSGTKYDTVLFDLGVRRDVENLPETFLTAIRAGGYGISVEKDVATILRENGHDLGDIGGIIWSHWHFDHAGDPQTLPCTTDLVVGPGFKANFVPGYPTVRNSHVDERAWAGRELHEIDFTAAGDSRTLQIGSFQAYDFYGDGSFYLLNSPGHAIGHMSALARTTADPPTFLLLGGDIAHHCGEFRPSPYVPMPTLITPHPLRRGTASACPAKIFLAIHPKHSDAEPFFDPVRVGNWHHGALEAKESINKLIEADAYDHIFPVMAHDSSLADVIDLYPKSANEWMAKGWKEASFWGFLGTFAAVEGDGSCPHTSSEKERGGRLEDRKDSRVALP